MTTRPYHRLTTFQTIPITLSPSPPSLTLALTLTLTLPHLLPLTHTQPQATEGQARLLEYFLSGATDASPEVAELLAAADGKKGKKGGKGGGKGKKEKPKKVRCVVRH